MNMKAGVPGRDGGSTGFSGPLGSREWGAGGLPKLKTLSALVEVYPELGRLAAIDPAAAADQGHSVGQQGTTRTKSEEEEYHHQQSVQLMHREQIQNEILLDTVKRIQGSTVGSLYENEIELLRTVIEQKQGFINKLHAEGLELLQKIEDYQLRLSDEEDRSREERERVLREAEAVEAAIDAISQDKQLAVQRLRQYEMLYKRTIEDKNDAESKMSRARELVSMGREDLRALGECLLQTKAMQEKHDRELSATMTRLESSRSTWRSSLEQRTREIDSIIRQYEEAKSSRIREEGAAARQRLEAERVRREMEVRERERASHQAREAERTNSVQVDRWRVVCAAAGLGEGSSAEAVIAAYEACKRLHPQDEDGHFDALEPARLAPPVQPVGATEANRSSPSGTPSLAPVRPCAMPSIRAEMSIRMIRQKLASYTGQDEAADDDALVEQLRMLLSDPASITDLADLTKEEDRTLGDAWDKATSAVKSTHVARVGPPKRSPSAPPSAPPSASSSRAPPPLTTAKAAGSDTDRDVELRSRILSRQEIKARSRKTHARLNKVGRVC